MRGKSLVRTVLIAAALTIALAAAGHAGPRGDDGDEGGGVRRHHAPEIDPASATAALAMLAGGVMVIRGRRR